MWFTLRATMYIKNLSAFVHLKIHLLTLYYKYKCSWVRGIHMVTYNLCVTISNTEYK